MTAKTKSSAAPKGVAESGSSETSPRRGRRNGALTLVLVALAAVLIVGPAGADDTLPPGTYTVTLNPSTSGAGASVTYTVSITNTSDLPVQTLAAATVALPDFTVTSPAAGMSAPASVAGALVAKQWVVTNDSDVLRFQARGIVDVLEPNESVSAQVAMTNACSPGAHTAITSATDGLNLFEYDPDGSAPRVTVVPGATTTFAFAQQPSRSQRGVAISPAVTVEARDTCGNGVPGEVEMAIGTNPAGGTLNGTLSQPLVDGIATFPDLSIDRTGAGYTLRATSGASSATSAAFDVFDVLCKEFPCTGSDEGNTTSVVVTGGEPLNGRSIGVNFTAPSLFTGFGDCGLLKPMGSVVTVAPDPDAAYASLLDVQFTYSKHVAPGTGVANFRFCARDGSNAAWYEVQNCAKIPVVPPKCISKRHRTGVGDLVIRALFTWADPDWGGFS